MRLLLELVFPLLAATQAVTSSTPFFTAPFSPSFATSALPISLSFPSAFTSQSLFFSFPTAPAPKAPKGGIYVPPNQPIPRDPQASASLASLLTISNINADKKGDKGIRALYDQSAFRSFNMEIPATNKLLMDQDPAAEMKVHCRLTTDYNTPEARTFSDFGVGCAYKGSVGSLRVCIDENKQDNHICRKLSFRADARAFKQPNYTAPLFHGASTLLFGGMPVDLSMMSERTAFSLMNSLGMTASLSTHAKLFINGKYMGLFSFVQDVDREFTKMHFDKDGNKGKGELKKELWFNPLHLDPNIRGTFDPSRNDDDMFLENVRDALNAAQLNEYSAGQFFDTYFDVDSLVNLTAFNTVIGATDDWRQRHNFYVYFRKPKRATKLFFIPWDYDRLYDAGSETRGALKGKPWWDIAATGTQLACNQLIRTSQEQAESMGGSPAKIAWNKDILDQFPPDINVPVTCDKFTQLMAVALGTQIRQRTREFASQISIPQLRSMWSVWNAQIATALSKDPAGPTYDVMLQHQTQLEQHLTRSMEKAVREANMKDASPGLSMPFPSAPTPFSPFAASPTPFSFSSTSSFSIKAPAAAPALAPRSLSLGGSSFASPASSTTTLGVASFSPKSTSISSTSFASNPFPSSSSFSSFPSSTFGTSFPASSTTVSWG